MQATGSAQDSVVATLEEVSRLHAVRADADAALFELAAVFADQHSGDTLPARSGADGAAGHGAGGAGRWGRDPARSRSSPVPSSGPGCR